MNTKEKAAFDARLAVYSHLVLPPRLPGRQDAKLIQIGNDLLERLIKATRLLASLSNQNGQWECLRRALQTCKVVNEGGKLNKASLLSTFRDLKDNDFLILHVTEQNAGLLVRRQQE
jgi:hypothetical protein